jgi:hypothetical protein
LLTEGDSGGFGVCDAEVDRERLVVSDFDTEGVIVGEAATDEDADGQPKPRVHVGLEENDVPNDFVVVWVNVWDTEDEPEEVLVIDFVTDPELLTEDDSTGLGLCDCDTDAELERDCGCDTDAELERDDDAVVDLEFDGVIVGVAAIDDDADGQPNPLVHVGLADADVPKLFDVEGVAVTAIEPERDNELLTERETVAGGLTFPVNDGEFDGGLDFDTDWLVVIDFETD